MSVETKVSNFEDQWKRMDEVHARKIDLPGFTVEEYSKRYGLTWDQARHRLRRLVQAGELMTDIVIRNRARTRVYRFPD
jgi:hypothetical protein